MSGHDHAHAALGHVEHEGEFVAVGEGPLRAGPHGEFSVGPLGYGRAGLERSMRDVRNSVGCIQPMRRAGQRFFHGSFLLAISIIGFRGRILLEIGKKFLVRNLRHFFPLRMDRIESTLRFVCARCGYADEISIAHNDHTRHGLRGGVIAGSERRTERRRTQHFAVKHSRGTQISGVLVAAGNKCSGRPLSESLCPQLSIASQA